MSDTVKTVVIGSSGYVGGELLRLIAGHPQLELVAAVSESNSGTPINSVFPHLHNALGEQCFIGPAELQQHLHGKVAIFSAAPHGASAGMIADVLAQAKNADVNIVDVSADFRFADSASYSAVYGEHGAPDLLDQFVCGLPEHMPNTEHPERGPSRMFCYRHAAWGCATAAVGPNRARTECLWHYRQHRFRSGAIYWHTSSGTQL